jgi:cell division septum initiation protein DivIVA
MTTEHPERRRNEVDRGGLFRTVMHGYDRRQVDDYVAELRARVSALEARLESGRRTAVRSGDAPVTGQRPGASGHEQVSRRMLQILQLAEDEARQTREDASRHAAAILAKAQAEARELLEAARSTAEELLRAAMSRSAAAGDEPQPPVIPDADRSDERRGRPASRRTGAHLGSG